MKKKILIGLNLLEILLIIGAYFIQMFTKTRMGMARHVLFKNQQWEKELPLDLIKYGMIAIILLFFVGLIMLYIKKKKSMNRSFLIRVFITSVLTLFTLIFLLLGSTSLLLSYYFIIQILMLTLIIDYLHVYFLFLTKK